jgi:hypothetical protein
MFPEYESVENFVEYAKAEGLVEASWQDIAELVSASPEPLARMREALAKAPVTIAASPSLLAETERQAIASMRQAHAQKVVRALRSHGLKIAERRPGDFDPWQVGEEEVTKKQTFLAVCRVATEKSFGENVPDHVKGAIQKFVREGIPGLPDPETTEGKRALARRSVEAACVLASLGFAGQARKLADDALSLSLDLPAESPAETPAA